MDNKDKIIGLDAGGSFLKIGHPNVGFSNYSLPYRKVKVQEIIKGFENILITGAGTKTISSWFPEKNFNSFNEFQATGIGGSYLSKQIECIVVNIGSGTPILYVNADKVEHIGGTGLGSATIFGLANFITDVKEIDQIIKMASFGNPNNVNLLIGDLYKNSEEEIGLPSYLTASNFGKYQDWRQDFKPSISDVLAGIHVLVAESIASIISNATKNVNHLPIVITGGGSLNPVLVNHLKNTLNFLNKTCIVPTNSMFASLTGLFVIENKIKIEIL